MPYAPYLQHWSTVYDYRRILTLILFMLLVFGTVLSKQVQNCIYTAYYNIPKHLQYMVLAIFFLGVLSAILNARSTNIALMQVAYYWVQFILFLFISGFLIENKSYYKVVISVAVLMCFFYGCLIGYRYVNILIYHLNHPEVKLHNLDRNIISPNFINVRFLNQYLSWIIPIVTLAIFVFKNKILKIFAFILVVFLWYIIIGSKSRVYILEYLLLIPLLLYIDRKLTYRYVVVSLIAIFLGWCVFEVVNNSLTVDGASVFQRDVFRENNRLILWGLAVNGFLSHPLLGIGAFQYPGYIFDVFRRASHPHNFYIQILCEWGIIVFGLFLYILIVSAISFIKKAKVEKTIQHLLILAAAFCGLVHAALSGVFVMPLSQYTAMIIFAMAFGFYHKAKASNEGNSLLSSRSIHMYLITFIAGLILIMTSFKQIKNYPIYINNYFGTCPNMIYNPNFWSIGWENIYPNLHKGIPFRCYPEGSVVMQENK
jgi:O-antigen ligase